jgi:hypothetical protein
MDQQIGGALGIAVITTISAIGAVPDRFASGLPAAFAGGVVLALVAAVVALRGVVAKGSTASAAVRPV